MADIDTRLELLVQRARTYLQQTSESAPDAEHLAALEAWRREAADIIARTRTLLPAKAQALLDDYNGRRPRRRNGRPATGVPSVQLIRRAVTRYLLEQALATHKEERLFEHLREVLLESDATKAA